jgi:hypothetical protein
MKDERRKYLVSILEVLKFNPNNFLWALKGNGGLIFILFGHPLAFGGP